MSEPTMASSPPTVRLERLSAGFASRNVLYGMALTAEAGRVTALIGPSGCGKSTVLRCINRLHERDTGAWVRGRIMLTDTRIDTEPLTDVAVDATAGTDVYADDVDVTALRRRIGMVFQHPTPFVTQSIFDNVAAGVRVNHPSVTKKDLEHAVEDALVRAGLWREVADRLFGNPMTLSGGQQQRLCIARALAVRPDVLLLDEPTASLDPIATQRVEELLYDLRGSVTMLLVTHNMQQAARISDTTAVLLDGLIAECAPTRQLFTTPRDSRAEAYVTGRFG